MKLYDVPGHDEPLTLSDEHAEIIGAIEHVDVEAMPTRNANKQAWIDYALSQGAHVATLEQMTRTEIIDAWG